MGGRPIGRTPDSGSGYPGSSPGLPANLFNELGNILHREHLGKRPIAEQQLWWSGCSAGKLRQLSVLGLTWINASVPPGSDCGGLRVPRHRSFDLGSSFRQRIVKNL